MTNEEIAKRFLCLLAEDWDYQAVRGGFADLRGQVSDKSPWANVIEARLLALAKKTEDAVGLLESIIAANPADFPAMLLLGAILSRDLHKQEEANIQFDRVLHGDMEGQIEPDWLIALALASKTHMRLEYVAPTRRRLTPVRMCYHDLTIHGTILSPIR